MNKQTKEGPNEQTNAQMMDGWKKMKGRNEGAKEQRWMDG